MGDPMSKSTKRGEAMKDEFGEKAKALCTNTHYKYPGNWSNCKQCKQLSESLQSEYRRGRESMREEAAKIASNLDCEGCYAEHYSSNYPPGFFDYNKAAEAIRGIEV